MSPETSPTAAPFRRVLAVNDLSETDAQVLRLAQRLVKDTGAGLSVLAAIDKRDEIHHAARFGHASEAHVRRDIVDAIRKILEAQLAESDLGDGVGHSVSVGKPFLDIIHQVLNEDHDLVIKAAETIGDPALPVFASTDQHLLRKCPCPVWLVNPDRRDRARSVLAAVDIDTFSASEPETMTALNTTILETAARLALFEGAALHVLHVWDAPAAGMARLFAAEQDSVGDYVRDYKAQHQRALDALVADVRENIGATTFDTLRLTQHLSQGEARDVIPSRLRGLGIDVLVLGTVARTGIPGLIIGNTAEDILNTVTCEVVTVKPPGYVSPVAGG